MSIIDTITVRFSSFLAGSLLLVASTLAGGQAIAQVAPPNVAVAAPAAEAPAVNEGYVVGPGDVLEVTVLGRQDFQARVQVQVDGTIQLPLIKDIKAVDRTVLQLRSDIRNALIQGKYFTDPAVSVVVVGYTSRYVTVLGEVGAPGLVPIDRSYRLSEIIARVGGLKPGAAEEIVITRASGETLTLDMKKVATGGGEQDPVVNPNDRIFVDKVAEFYITGQVNAPGVHALRRGMTLRMALAQSGGLTAQGSKNKVKVFRNGKEIEKFAMESVIEPEDSIEVGEKFF